MILHSLLTFQWKHLFPKVASIRIKLITAFLVLSFFPLLALAIFSYQSYLKILQGNIRFYTHEVLDRVDDHLRIFIDDLERVLLLNGDYYTIQFIKLSLTGDIAENRKYIYRVWENLNHIKQLKTDVRDIAVVTTEGIKISSYGLMRQNLSRDRLFQTLANQTMGRDALVVWGPHEDWLGDDVFSVGRAIYGDYDNFLGIVCIDVELKVLERICRNIQLGKTGYVMLIDGEGRIIYHPDPEWIGKSAGLVLGDSHLGQWQSGLFISRLKSRAHVIGVKTYLPANWRIIGISDQAELAGEMLRVVNWSLILILALIPGVIFAALVLAGVLTRPIKALQQSMDRAAEDLHTQAVITTHDEIGQLAVAFNQMLARIRQLMDQSMQEQKKLRRAEMMALQEQIKPHFIYNTLEVIIGLLENNRNEDVIKMVEALGSFFRTSLNQGRERITVREEVEHLANYLYIQKFRHGNSYDYRIEVDPILFNYRIIKLILQPLVENAIYHGIRELGRPGGRILIRGYLTDESRICFEIQDNGGGMESWKLLQINQCLHHLDDQETAYFGLRNVHQRIMLAFGNGYGVRLAFAPGGGILATVVLPVLIDGKE